MVDDAVAMRSVMEVWFPSHDVYQEARSAPWSVSGGTQSVFPYRRWVKAFLSTWHGRPGSTF